MVREIGRTTEALRTTKDAKPGDEGIRELPGMRVVAVRGPDFLKWMTEYIMPLRRDTAQLVLSATLQSNRVVDEGVHGLVEFAYDVADEFMLQERPTCDVKLDKYWDRYMTRGDDTEDVMRSLAEEAQDYSL